MQALKLGDIRRILVLNRNHIGDCLLTTPLLRALKRRFPRAHLAVSVPASNTELLITNPHVDEIVPRPEIKRWAQKVRFAVEIRRGQYDLIISLQEKSKFYGYATAYTTLLNRRAPVTVGLDHPRTRRFFAHNVPLRPEQHEVFKYLDIAALLGCPKERRPVLELLPTDSSRERVLHFLDSRGIDCDARFVGLNPGASTDGKRWPVERFAEVGDRLHEELGLPSMILGGPEDQERAAEIVERMTTHRPLVAAGRATLGETAALLERCELLVTNDTGPMHMAVAMAVPVVAIFGPTSPIKYGPFSTRQAVLRHDRPCADCRNRVDLRPQPGPPRPCVHTVRTEEAVRAATQLYTVPPPPPKRPNRVQSDGR